jgi:hypothetical protein
MRLVQPAIVHLEFRDCCASCSSFFIALAGMLPFLDTTLASVPLVSHACMQAFTSVSWTACWVVVHLHYGIIVWLLRQRPRVMPSHAAGVRS